MQNCMLRWNKVKSKFSKLCLTIPPQGAKQNKISKNFWIKSPRRSRTIDNLDLIFKASKIKILEDCNIKESFWNRLIN